MKFAAVFLFIGFTIPVVSQSVAAPCDKPPVRPSYTIIVNQGPDNDCVQGYVDLKVTLGPDDRVANAIVLASHPEQLFDNAALERVKGSRLGNAFADENRVLLVRVSFEISVHQLKRCLDAANAS